MKPVGRYPFSVDVAKRRIANQNLARPMIFGSQRYSGREASLEFLMLRCEGAPEFFSVPSLASIWGRMAIDYVQKVKEGVRRLTQLGSKSDGLKDLKRRAMHPQGWQFPHTFCTESIKGYWRRYVLPRIDLATGKAEYRVALLMALASFVVATAAENKPI